MSRVRIEDVAQSAGVSTATVSRVLSGASGVRPATKELVLSAVRRLNFVPDSSARALASGKTHTIGCVIPTLDHAIFAKSTQSLQKTLAQAGYQLLVASFEYDLQQEYEVVQALQNRGVDALVLVGADHAPSLWKSLDTWGKPTLLTWSLDERLPSIGFDNLAAGQFAAEYLFGLGHQRVAVISGSTKHNDRARMRVAGVRRAYEQRGLDLPAHYVVEQEMSIYGGEQAISTLLAQSTPPSAVFCANDLLAAGALLQASKMGLSIPDELSICGMDNHELSSALYPALTTIGLPTKELGVLAAEYLLNRIQNKPVAQRLVLPFHLIERQSTGRWRKE